MHRKVHVRFGPGATGKGSIIGTPRQWPTGTKVGDVFHLALTRHCGSVLIEVRDTSEAAPHPRPQSTDRIDGRGLLLVQACALDWGWRLEDHGGKTTWALVGEPLHPPPTADVRM